MDSGLQHIVELSSHAVSLEEAEQLATLRPSGVMFRSKNFLQDAPYHEWIDAYRILIQDIQAAIGRPNIFVSIDHEGGRVIRPPEPITRFPYAIYWKENFDAVIEAMAIELQSLGINLVFSPIADIHTNPSNPVIGPRAYATTPHEVAERAKRALHIFSAHGLLSCAKHFPGHGDVSSDSHRSLPVCTRSLAELESQELIPFRALIEDGIASVMTGHLLFPSIDATNLVTLSPIFLRDILRKHLNFPGLVVSDALGMSAIAGSLTKEDIAIRAVDAGVDLLLFVGDAICLSDALLADKAVQQKASRDETFHKKIQASVAKIESVMLQLSTPCVSQLDNSVFEAHHKLAQSIPSTLEWGAGNLHFPGFE
jgi:beta-N-acetylhexosaminidase